MLNKTIDAIASGLYRQMPVKGDHSGRGMSHSEKCWATCYDSWQRCVSEMAWVIFGANAEVNPRAKAFIAKCKGEIV